MRDALSTFVGGLVGGAAIIGTLIIVGHAVNVAAQDPIGHATVGNVAERVNCNPATGAPTTMACQTGADADSGALTANKLYRIMCDTDAWVDFGTAAVTATADDTYVPAFQPQYFTTENARIHVSCLSVAVNGDCRLTLCN